MDKIKLRHFDLQLNFASYLRRSSSLENCANENELVYIE